MSDNHDLLNDNDMCSFSGHEAEDMCFNCGDHTCGDCGVATKKGYVEILEFTHFVEFFSFNKIGENHIVALDLGCGNTKNSEYESE